MQRRAGAGRLAASTGGGRAGSARADAPPTCGSCRPRHEPFAPAPVVRCGRTRGYRLVSRISGVLGRASPAPRTLPRFRCAPVAPRSPVPTWITGGGRSGSGCTRIRGGVVAPGVSLLRSSMALGRRAFRNTGTARIQRGRRVSLPQQGDRRSCRGNVSAIPGRSARGESPRRSLAENRVVPRIRCRGKNRPAHRPLRHDRSGRRGSADRSAQVDGPRQPSSRQSSGRQLSLRQPSS